MSATIAASSAAGKVSAAGNPPAREMTSGRSITCKRSRMADESTRAAALANGIAALVWTGMPAP